MKYIFAASAKMQLYTPRRANLEVLIPTNQSFVRVIHDAWTAIGGSSATHRTEDEFAYELGALMHQDGVV